MQATLNKDRYYLRTTFGPKFSYFVRVLKKKSQTCIFSKYLRRDAKTNGNGNAMLPSFLAKLFKKEIGSRYSRTAAIIWGKRERHGLF